MLMEFSAPDIEKLTTNYDTLHDLPTVHMDKGNLPLENASSTDIPYLEQNLMSLSEFSPDIVVKLQKNDTFFQKYLRTYTLQQNDNYFTDAMDILHKKAINFNSMFSAVVIPQILICLS